MDISSVVNSTIAQTGRAQPGKDDVGVAVLKTALDSQKQSAAQLIESVPQPASMPNLGNNVNVTA